MDVRKLAFLLLFAILVFVGSQISFSKVIGAQNASFTLYQFFGPLPAAFLGLLPGVGAVFLAGLAMLVVGGAVSLFAIARLFTMPAAAYYFGSRWEDKKALLIPIACMLAFLLHPIGILSWFITLFWLIPVALRFFPDNALFRSIGATFTAHAVGTTAFIYLFPTTPEFWLALIPIILFERTVFSIGIFASYIATNTLLAKLPSRLTFNVVSIDRKCVIA